MMLFASAPKSTKTMWRASNNAILPVTALMTLAAMCQPVVWLSIRAERGRMVRHCVGVSTSTARWVHLTVSDCLGLTATGMVVTLAG